MTLYPLKVIRRTARRGRHGGRLTHPEGASVRARGWQGRKTWLAPLVAATSVAALAACASTGGSSGGGVSSGGSGSSGDGSTYTIHAIVSETGSDSFLGVEEKAALQALAKHVNATGGIGGKKLSFDVSDNQSTASTSVSLASPILSQSPVILVGSVTTTDPPLE